MKSNRLILETLESRLLPAGVVALADGIVSLTGSIYDDVGLCSLLDQGTATAHDDQIQVTLYNTSEPGTIIETLNLYELQTGIWRKLVKSIEFQGDNGQDWFHNDTALKCIAHGGSGHDQLYGGTGKDQFYGEDGNDTLWGLEGSDYLNGGIGLDVLEGHDGADSLIGAENDDLLFGGLQSDFLSGGDGNDALCGGLGKDTANGGTGRDRLLRFKDAKNKDPDVLTFVSGQDVRINFNTGEPEPVLVNDVYVTYVPQLWDEDHIKQIDEVLANLQSATGGNGFLKRSDGSDLIFELFSNTNGPAFNDGKRIVLNQGFFNAGADWIRAVTLHEMGHHWETESPIWKDFRALSGWTKTNPHDDAFTHVIYQDEDWWYLTAAGFAEDYAKSGPLEDFACSFSAYFVNRFGWTYPTGGGPAAIPEKLALLDVWVGTP